LSAKLADKKLIIVEDFNLEAPKTKEYLADSEEFEGRCKEEPTCYTGADKFNVVLSARNIPNAYICTPEKLNTYVILNNDTVVFTESSVSQITEILN
jgi:large subunit ribosomal protein L4